MVDSPECNVDFLEDLGDTSDLPTSVIITNMDPVVFADECKKMQLENNFKEFDENATFQYFENFRRVRVNYSNSAAAANARIQCHHTKIGDNIVNCYFAQPVFPSGNKSEVSDTHLQPPPPDKQFIISPPASPPVGWEPVDEARPCINYDLLSALSKLAPGEAHELHPPSESHPGIVVHVCEDQKTDGRRLKIMQTMRPEGMQSSSNSLPNA